MPSIEQLHELARDAAHLVSTIVKTSLSLRDEHQDQIVK